jgi:hypothetical protein
MATEISNTTSNRAQLSDTEAVRKLLEKWSFIPGNLGTALETKITDEGVLKMWGECSFNPYRESEVGPGENPHECVDVQQFLEELAPYLENNLVIQTIAHTKSRYPFGGFQYMIDASTGEVKVESFHDRQHEFFSSSEQQSQSY